MRNRIKDYIDVSLPAGYRVKDFCDILAMIQDETEPKEDASGGLMLKTISRSVRVERYGRTFDLHLFAFAGQVSITIHEIK